MIGTILKQMLSSGISIKRWNNFPRIEDLSHLDNVGFVLHIALFLAYLEEKRGNKVDKEFLIKRILFDSFSILIISDINGGTKNYIKKIDKNIFSKLEKKVYEYLFSLDSPEFIKNDMKNVVENNEKKLELLIIKASRKYSSLKECEVNSKIYKEIYDVPYNGILEDIDELKQELKSFEEFLSNKNYQKYISNIRRLSHNMRWNKQKRIFPISVMSHIVLVTFLSYIIGMIENENNGNYNLLEMMLIGAHHDIGEAIAGDVITPTKKAVLGFEEILSKAEENMLDDYLFSYVGDDYKNLVKDYINNPWKTKDGELVKVCDVLSALYEEKIELNNGGNNFLDIYRGTKKKINTYKYKSLDYILKNVSDSFDTASEDIFI